MHGFVRFQRLQRAERPVTVTTLEVLFVVSLVRLEDRLIHEPLFARLTLKELYLFV